MLKSSSDVLQLTTTDVLEHSDHVEDFKTSSIALWRTKRINFVLTYDVVVGHLLCF